MKQSREQWALRVLSGEARGVGPSLLRGALAVAEPFYAGAMTARNALYDGGILRSHKLPRPTISVGNLTTGGTGKTPIVRWLAEQLIAKDLRPAILMRGYRGEQTGVSDEAQMLADLLGGRAAVIANPNRVAGAMAAMQQSPPPDVFLLDDGFQHRRVRRDFDLVLVNAAEPFGHGHVLPRGLLREPISALGRAHAFVITRADAADGKTLEWITYRLRSCNNYGAVHVADHVHAAIVSRDDQRLPIETLGEKKFFAFAGIANPASLQRQFQAYGASFAGFRAFPDHHAYTPGDLGRLSAEAAAAGAETLVTTEKDWVKVRSLPSQGLLPIVRTELQVRFRDADGEELLALIMRRITAARPASSSGAGATEASPTGAAKAP